MKKELSCTGVKGREAASFQHLRFLETVVSVARLSMSYLSTIESTPPLPELPRHNPKPQNGPNLQNLKVLTPPLPCPPSVA